MLGPYDVAYGHLFSQKSADPNYFNEGILINMMKKFDITTNKIYRRERVLMDFMLSARECEGKRNLGFLINELGITIAEIYDKNYNEYTEDQFIGLKNIFPEQMLEDGEITLDYFCLDSIIKNKRYDLIQLLISHIDPYSLKNIGELLLLSYFDNKFHPRNILNYIEKINNILSENIFNFGECDIDMDQIQSKIQNNVLLENILDFYKCDIDIYQILLKIPDTLKFLPAYTE
jgi:hypothetical protein